MPVVVTCRCGQSFRAIDELAGKQVNCPSCAQPLVIPPLKSAASSAADDPLDLGDASGFERSAVSAHDSLGSAFSSGLPRQSEGVDRSVVLAFWIGGSVVVVLILAMVLTSLFSGSDAAPEGQSVTEAEPKETPVAAPAQSKPETRKAASKPIETEPAADRSNANAPAQAKKNPQKPNPKTRSQDQTPKTSGISIELSAGTALAQTLPTGTAMGFSVDYKFANGQPDTSGYSWVILTGDGQPIKKSVRLQSKGTLQDFVPQLRPENGPFHTYIEDQRGTRLSESLKLR